MTEQHPSPAEHLAAAYNRMMERVHELMKDAEDKAIPTLEEGIRHAVDKAVDLGEVTREEAEKIGEWIRRDMEDATHYVGDGGREFAAWLKFDIGQVEQRLLDALFSVADRTRLELDDFERRMAANNIYHAGEVAGAGVLECIACGEQMHVYETTTIGLCANCRGSRFRRPRA